MDILLLIALLIVLVADFIYIVGVMVRFWKSFDKIEDTD